MEPTFKVGTLFRAERHTVWYAILSFTPRTESFFKKRSSQHVQQIIGCRAKHHMVQPENTSELYRTITKIFKRVSPLGRLETGIQTQDFSDVDRALQHTLNLSFPI